MSVGRQTSQKSSPNGVRWMLRRTVLPRPEASSASVTLGWASSTWYSSGSVMASRENQISPSR